MTDQTRTKEFYESRHEINADYSGGIYNMAHLMAIPAVKQWFSDKSGVSLSVMDVGCGKAVFLRDLLAASRKAWGVEWSQVTGVDLCHSPGDVFDDISPTINFVQQNVEQVALPAEEGAYDVVTCNHVLEHVFDTEKLLRELHRVTRPGGMVIVSVPNIAAWINRILFLFACQPLGTEVGTESCAYGFWPKSKQAHLEKFNPSGHIRDFTPRGLADLTEACGFRVEGWWNQDAPPLLRGFKWSGRGVGVILIR